MVYEDNEGNFSFTPVENYAMKKITSFERSLNNKIDYIRPILQDIFEWTSVDLTTNRMDLAVNAFLSAKMLLNGIIENDKNVITTLEGEKKIWNA